MRRISFICITLFLSLAFVFLSLGSSVAALSPSPTHIEYALPYPGLLPDHPLYTLKTWRDRILILLTRDPLKRSQLYLLFADKHMGMGQSLWDGKQYDLATATFIQGEKYLLTSASTLVSLRNENKLPPGVAEKVGLSAKKHEEILNKLQAISDAEKEKMQLTEALGMTYQAMQQVASLK